MPLPIDFKLFWEDTTQEALDYPLEFSLDKDLKEQKNHIVQTYSFKGMHGETLYGWIASPHQKKQAPGFLWVAPYGRWSVPPDEHGTQEGYTSISFNFHGESAFYHEDYRVERGYFKEGIDHKETWIYRRFYQNSVLAFRILGQHSSVDPDHLGVMGMSQGGGMSIWMGSWVPNIKAVCSWMPFLGDMNEVIAHKVCRYPNKEILDYIHNDPLKKEYVFHTMSYYDTAYQARYCKVPTLVALGNQDPACTPPTVEKIYDSLPQEKKLVRYDCGHVWHPQAITDSREWLEKYL